MEKMNFILLDDGVMDADRVASILAAAVLYPLLFDLRKWWGKLGFLIDMLTP